MIEQLLPTIKDPADYIAALSLFKVDVPLTKEEAERLLALYAKYRPEAEDPDYLKICLAVDLLPGRDREEAAGLAALGLDERSLEALFTTKEVVAGREDLTEERAAHIVAQATDEALPMPLRVLVARTALDGMTASRNYVALRQHIAALAAFLSGIGAGTLDRYTTLVGEVRMKCRR